MFLVFVAAKLKRKFALDLALNSSSLFSSRNYLNFIIEELKDPVRYCIASNQPQRTSTSPTTKTPRIFQKSAAGHRDILLAGHRGLRLDQHGVLHHPFARRGAGVGGGGGLFREPSFRPDGLDDSRVRRPFHLRRRQRDPDDFVQVVLRRRLRRADA